MEDLLECTITVPSAEQRIATSQIRFEFPQFVTVRPVGYDQIKLVGPKSAFEALYRKTAN